MKTAKILFPLALIAALLAGCGGGANYTLTTYGLDPDLNVVEMQTYHPDSEFFTFRYDTTKWTLEEWPEEEAPNTVALVHNGYEDGSCYLLPGTFGEGVEEGSLSVEGTLLTQKHIARTVDVMNAAGIKLMHVVGYDVGDFSYVFELNLPLRDTETCEVDGQSVTSSFHVKAPVVEEEEDDEEEEEEAEEEGLGSTTSTIVIEELPLEE